MCSRWMLIFALYVELKKWYKNSRPVKHCGTKLTLIAMIQSPLACRKILEHLKLPIFEIGMNTARAPPEFEFFDQQVDYF